MNGMAGGIGDGHPALLDLNVRHAIAPRHRRGRHVRRVILGLGEKGAGLSVSADPAWKPDIPEDEQYTYDPEAAANELLDEGGYVDTERRRRPRDAGRRQTSSCSATPSGPSPSRVRRSASSSRVSSTEVGIGTDVSVFDDTQLTDVIASGEYDLFVVGMDAVRRSRPDAVVLHVRPGHHRHRVGRVQRRQLVHLRVRRAVRAAERRARP